MQSYTKDGYPILENLSDKVLYTYNPMTRLTTIVSKADRAVSLEESLDMMAELLKRYQTVYSVAKDSPWEIFMPNLLIEPNAGDKVKNESTGEIYEIKQVLIDPETKKFVGNLLLETGTTAPDVLQNQCLSFLRPDNYIRFVDEAPETRVGSERETSQGHGTSIPSMKPTITNTLIRQEPGSYNGFFKSSGKELKPRVREVFPDPDYRGYSIEAKGQIFDSLVQFDCWSNDPLTARRLVTWFETFVRENSWILLKNGVGRLLFWAKLRDENTNRYGQDAHARSIQYVFRTETIHLQRRRHLMLVNTNVGVSDTFVSEEDQKLDIVGQAFKQPLSRQNYRSIFFDNNGNYRFGRISQIDDGGLTIS